MKKQSAHSVKNETVVRQVKKIIQAYDIKPKRERGQNFLVDPSVIATMIAVSEVKNTDTILEVGPGLGILTESLVQKAKKVVAVELDEKLLTFLRVKFRSMGNLQLISGDILHWKPESAGLLTSQYKVVANLPYQITSHFLRQYLTMTNRPSSMTLLLQREVVERICAKPGS